MRSFPMMDMFDKIGSYFQLGLMLSEMDLLGL